MTSNVLKKLSNLPILDPPNRPNKREEEELKITENIASYTMTLSSIRRRGSKSSQESNQTYPLLQEKGLE